MVGARGFEPRTSCAQGRRATRLRYAPMAAILTYTPDFLFVPRLSLFSADANLFSGELRLTKWVE